MGYETACEEAEPLWVMQQHMWAEPESLWVIKKNGLWEGPEPVGICKAYLKGASPIVGYCIIFYFYFCGVLWEKYLINTIHDDSLLMNVINLL